MAVVPDGPSTAPTAARAAKAAPPSGQPLGEVIAGRYELHEILGRGGVGVVYRAKDRELGETLAIKLLAGPSSSDPQEVERFKREIITARRITHPNVIRIHEFGMSGSEAFISMELLPGGTLADLIEKESPIDLRRAAEIAVGICEGLEAAHAQGIVHRDLKPDNVLFDAAGNPKLVDFGLARLATSTTKTVGFSGTPFYMSPEQADGSEVTSRSDLYSLGVLLYELFTGKLPFVADSLVRIALLHANEAPSSPRSVRPDLPTDIDALLLRALQKDPMRRFARAADIAEDLRLWLGGRAMKHTVVTDVSMRVPANPAHEETAAVRPTRQPTLKASQRDVRLTESPMVDAARTRQEETTIVGSPPPVAPVSPSSVRTETGRGAGAPPPRRPSIPERAALPRMEEAAFELPPSSAPPEKKSRAGFYVFGGIVAAGLFAAGIYGAAHFGGIAIPGMTAVASPAPTEEHLVAVETPSHEHTPVPIPSPAASAAHAIATPEARASSTPRPTAKPHATPAIVARATPVEPVADVYGTVSIGSRPVTDVFIDGKSVAPNGHAYGMTPRFVEIPIGDHVLTLKQGADVLYEGRIYVRPQANVPLKFKRDPTNAKKLVPDTGNMDR